MGEIIELSLPARMASEAERVAAMLQSFALHRRIGDDVFWLKENAELLNILECTGTPVPASALAVHEPFYHAVEKRLAFFPQYYRFLLSITLDLEALGLGRGVGERVVSWAAKQGLAEAELSDLQRAEARRLMARRGVDPLPRDGGLDDRLRGFIARPQVFALPNKKAAYELTHIVFYLSEYGRRDPELDDAALTSLHFAGLLAYLDQNADLLAEICVALQYAGAKPPALWRGWLERETHLFSVEGGPDISVNDDYHEYLVCNWYSAQTGGALFAKPVAPERMRFDRSLARTAPLREMSQALLQLDDARCADWPVMRRRMAPLLSPEAMDALDRAEESSAHFAPFFEGFARAGRG